MDNKKHTSILSFAMDFSGNTSPPQNSSPLSDNVGVTIDEDTLEELESLLGLNITSPSSPNPYPEFSPLPQTQPVENLESPPLNTNNVLVNSDTSDDDDDFDMGEEEENLDNKKTRGRPHGSKNKPKQVTIEPFILHIFPGEDIIEKVVSFACVHNFGMSMVCGHGHVTELDVSYPNAEPWKIIGSFKLISCTGYFSNDPSACFCKVSIADSQGNVINELLAQRLIAKNQVQLVGTHK